MSLMSLTTIAAVREQAAPGARPKKGQVGKVPPHHTDAAQNASITDVLAKQLPTELVAPYTALTAAIVGAIAKPTTTHPHPDQLVVWRWTAFAVLIASVALLVWFGKWQKTGTRTFPIAPAGAGVLTAAVWACMMPGSPIDPYLHSTHAQTLVPLFIAIGGVVAAAGTAAILVQPAPVAAPQPA